MKLTMTVLVLGGIGAAAGYFLYRSNRTVGAVAGALVGALVVPAVLPSFPFALVGTGGPFLAQSPSARAGVRSDIDGTVLQIRV